jgi:hypothetical protein
MECLWRVSVYEETCTKGHRRQANVIRGSDAGHEHDACSQTIAATRAALDIIKR